MTSLAPTGNSETLPFQSGDLLAEKYRLDKVLGQGGMGVVFSALHTQLDEPVAIKLLLPSAIQNPEAVVRFGREARAAAKIRSEHVARVFDVGTLHDGTPYMVMEFLEGEDLAVHLEKRGRLTVGVAVEYILQACEAIAEAHTLGIVHRDLKPGNLFITTRADGSPTVKVLDFGISKVVDRVSRAESALTRTRSVMGSPLYMAPEQMRASRNVDVRSDIWALGMILVEMLSGRPAFDGDTIPEICIHIVNDPPVLPTEAPEPLREVLAKCLAKDPSARYQTVGDLANALAPFGTERARISLDRVRGVLQRAGVTSGSLEPPPTSVESGRPSRLAAVTQDAPLPSEKTRDALAGAPAGPRSRRRDVLFAAAAIVGAAAAFLVLTQFTARRPAEAPRATPATQLTAPSEPAQPARSAPPAPPAAPPPAAPEKAASPEPSSAPTADEEPPAAEPSASAAAPASARPRNLGTFLARPARPAVSAKAAPSAPVSTAPRANPAGLFDEPK